MSSGTAYKLSPSLTGKMELRSLHGCITPSMVTSHTWEELQEIEHQRRDMLKRKELPLLRVLMYWVISFFFGVVCQPDKYTFLCHVSTCQEERRANLGCCRLGWFALTPCSGSSPNSLHERYPYCRLCRLGRALQ